MHRQAVRQQALHHRTTGCLDRHPHRLGRRRGNRLGDPRRHRRQPRPAVREHVLATHRASAVEHAHLVVLPTPVHADVPAQFRHHASSSLFLPMLQACRDAHLSLYWRSRRGLFTGRPSRQKTAGARVLRRCSWHRGRVVAPGSSAQLRGGATKLFKSVQGHESYVGARGTGDGWSLPAALPSFAAVPRNCSKAYRGRARPVPSRIHARPRPATRVGPWPTRPTDPGHRRCWRR